jgi:hypothetical protein
MVCYYCDLTRPERFAFVEIWVELDWIVELESELDFSVGGRLWREGKGYKEMSER